MDFFIQNIIETLEALNKLTDNKTYMVNTKRFRRCNNIKSSNRSKISFIWRSLKFLQEQGIVEAKGALKPKSYIIKYKEKININNLISKIQTLKHNITTKKNINTPMNNKVNSIYLR